MNRRKFLTIVGGGVILAAGTTLGVVATRTPDKALLPWAQAGSLYKDPVKNALSYAILAPNPHNRQPWLVDLSVANQATLTVDTTKMLPHTDPFNRQITIGLGCFLEIMTMAAAQNGYRVDLDMFPEGAGDETLDGRPVAIARFAKDASITPDPLFQYVLQRRTYTEPFDTEREVSLESLERIEKAARNGMTLGTSKEQKTVAKLRQISRDAMAAEFDTPRTYKESVDLFRLGKAEVEANPDGIDLSGPFFETLHFIGAMTRDKLLDPTSSMFSEGKKTVLDSLNTAMAHIWGITAGNSRIDQINAGRDWVRINLAATAEGIGFHPLSQPLQEYPEVKSLYDETHALLASDGGTIQMLARLGYGSDLPQSPRWPLEAKIQGG